MVKKSHKAKFMRISGVLCKYPCILSYDKGERYRIGGMAKEIYFWCGELVQSIWLGLNLSKGISE